jgi:hypothetical protein
VDANPQHCWSGEGNGRRSRQYTLEEKAKFARLLQWFGNNFAIKGTKNSRRRNHVVLKRHCKIHCKIIANVLGVERCTFASNIYQNHNQTIAKAILKFKLKNHCRTIANVISNHWKYMSPPLKLFIHENPLQY